MLQPPAERRGEVLRQRAKGRFLALNSALLFDLRDIDRATSASWMKRHGYEELFETFKAWLTGPAWRPLRQYGELYVYQVADWYEADVELSSLLESHVLLLAKAALATGCKIPCKLVEPPSRRNRGRNNVASVVPMDEPTARLGQTRFAGW